MNSFRLIRDSHGLRRWGRACPCHFAGRPLQASWPPLSRSKPRFAIVAPLDFLRRSMGTSAPSDPQSFQADQNARREGDSSRRHHPAHEQIYHTLRRMLRGGRDDCQGAGGQNPSLGQADGCGRRVNGLRMRDDPRYTSARDTSQHGVRGEQTFGEAYHRARWRLAAQNISGWFRNPATFPAVHHVDRFHGRGAAMTFSTHSSKGQE